MGAIGCIVSRIVSTGLNFRCTNDCNRINYQIDPNILSCASKCITGSNIT